MDFRHTPTFLINYLKNNHNIHPDNEYILFESATELLANLLNNIFLSRSIQEFCENLDNEILFSTLQVAKILKVCKYKSWQEFIRIRIGTGKPFKQDSCVFSYYVLKLYLLLNLDNYFNLCLDNQMRFMNSDHSFNNLIKIFESSKNNKSLANIINELLVNLDISNIVNDVKDRKNRNSGRRNTKKNKDAIASRMMNKINKTLRMTCLEGSNKIISKNTI
jgi:hypothetical protein